MSLKRNVCYTWEGFSLWLIKFDYFITIEGVISLRSDNSSILLWGSAHRWYDRGYIISLIMEVNSHLMSYDNDRTWLMVVWPNIILKCCTTFDLNGAHPCLLGHTCYLKLNPCPPNPICMVNPNLGKIIGYSITKLQKISILEKWVTFQNKKNQIFWIKYPPLNLFIPHQNIFYKIMWKVFLSIWGCIYNF